MKPNALKKYGKENIERMKKGLAPQRYNDARGGIVLPLTTFEPSLPEINGHKKTQGDVFVVSSTFSYGHMGTSVCQ
jgi:hypothetical protein